MQSFTMKQNSINLSGQFLKEKNISCHVISLQIKQNQNNMAKDEEGIYVAL